MHNSDALDNVAVASFIFVLETQDKDGNVVSREEGSRVTVTAGWECGHGVWTEEEAEDRRQEQGVAAITDATCEWCESINRQLDAIAASGTPTQSERYDARLRPCRYIECLNCEERISVKHAAEHLWGGDC